MVVQLIWDVIIQQTGCRNQNGIDYLIPTVEHLLPEQSTCLLHRTSEHCDFTAGEFETFFVLTGCNRINTCRFCGEAAELGTTAPDKLSSSGPWSVGDFRQPVHDLISSRLA